MLRQLLLHLTRFCLSFPTRLVVETGLIGFVTSRCKNRPMFVLASGAFIRYAYCCWPHQYHSHGAPLRYILLGVTLASQGFTIHPSVPSLPGCCGTRNIATLLSRSRLCARRVCLGLIVYIEYKGLSPLALLPTHRPTLENIDVSLLM